DKRFELRLDGEQKRGLASLASQMGVSASDIVRLSLAKLLGEGGLIFGAVRPADPVKDFLAELRSSPAFAPVVDDLERALASLDRESNSNSSAAGLAECLAVIARAYGPIESKLKLMATLVNLRGVTTVTIPRKQPTCRAASAA